MPPNHDDARQYFDVLELEPGASTAEVEQAYREMAKIWHPDRFPDDARLRERTEKKMKEINKAREEILAYQARTEAQMSREDTSPTAHEHGAGMAPHRAGPMRGHLPPRLLVFSIVLFIFLLTAISRVPLAMGLGVLLIVVALVFSSSRKD